MELQIFILIFLALCGAGILLSLIVSSAARGGIFAWLGCLASVTLVCIGGKALLAVEMFKYPLWNLPGLVTLTLRVDHLSAVFLIVTGLVLFPASIFASAERGRAFIVMMFALYASIALILISGDAVLFLLAWEAMSILCYLLIVCARQKENGYAGAGYLLLAMGETGTVASAVSFLMLAGTAGTLDFAGIKAGGIDFGSGTRWLIFLLSFFGFGVKAGLVPVNFWLPRAYLSAPRHFVPVLAGVTLNLGLYGILRVNADLLPAANVGPGLVALIVGTITALVGILYATTDNDLKLMLAHSSIENAGIITTGFGAGMVFVATNHPVPAVIAFTAGLYHLVNHSCYKALLFFGVGAVEAQTGSRDMDRLGGLIKWMPLTAAGFLVGTLSIAALPPFNGFVSEWLTLQTMLRSSELSSPAVKLVFALSGAGLALTAALAVTCFVKVYAMSFLGMRRLDLNQKVTEANKGALVSIFILAAFCLILGVLPSYVIPSLGPAVDPLAGPSAADALVPPFFVASDSHTTLPPDFAKDFHNLGAQVGESVLPGRGLVVLHRGGTANPVVFAMSTAYSFVVLLGLLFLVWVVIRLWLTSKRRLARQPRWDGGVRRLLPEMTYTATGFSNPVRVIFTAVFRPTTVEDTRETVAEHFRTAIRRDKEQVHLVEKLVLLPVRATAMWCAHTLAKMHHGRFNAYAAYTLVALLAALVVFLLFQTG
jgi:hydrogenase-4 component B